MKNLINKNKTQIIIFLLILINILSLPAQENKVIKMIIINHYDVSSDNEVLETIDIQKYNNKGKIVYRESKYSNGDKIKIEKYAYYSDSKIKSYMGWKAFDFVYKEKYKYKNNNLIKIDINYAGEKYYKKNIYNEKNLIIKEEKFNYKFNELGRDKKNKYLYSLDEITLYEYDKMDRIISLKVFNEDMILQYKSIYEYINNGKTVINYNYKNYENEDIKLMTYLKTFDENNNLIEEIDINSNDTISSHYKYKYDLKNRIIEEMFFAGNGEMYSVSKYIYENDPLSKINVFDSKNNLDGYKETIKTYW